MMILILAPTLSLASEPDPFSLATHLADGAQESRPRERLGGERRVGAPREADDGVRRSGRRTIPNARRRQQGRQVEAHPASSLHDTGHFITRQTGSFSKLVGGPSLHPISRARADPTSITPGLYRSLSMGSRPALS